MNRIADRRKELGMTQPELAAILRSADPRIDTGMVSRFERDVCIPTEGVMLALETALQAPRSALFDEFGLLCTPIEIIAPMDDLTLLLVSKLPTGKENAISRETLANELGMADRHVRKLIEQARRDGLPIINNQDGRGYYIASTIEDAESQIKRNERRAMSILAQNRVLRRMINENA